MLEAHDFWLFLSASFLLWITPGPDTMYILARTVSQGRLAGVISVFGVSAGILAHTTFAAIGLSAILAPESGNSSSIFLLLGGIFVLGATLWCLLLVAFAASFTGAVRSNTGLSEAVGKVTGLMYIGLGLNLLRAKL